MKIKNNFLFFGLEINQETKEKLDERISRNLEKELYSLNHPFEEITRCDVTFWGMSVSGGKIYTGFPQGAYDSEEQANLALSLWKVNPELDYKELYFMSKFILQGLQ
jgi:hypothetical protein